MNAEATALGARIQGNFQKLGGMTWPPRPTVRISRTAPMAKPPAYSTTLDTLSPVVPPREAHLPPTLRPSRHPGPPATNRFHATPRSLPIAGHIAGVKRTSRVTETMPSSETNRRHMKLGEAARIKHGFAFKSQYFSDSGEYVVLTPGNFNEGGGFRLRPDKDRFYMGVVPQEYVLKKNDLIVAMTEQGPGLLGSAAVVPEGGRYLHNQRLGLVDEIDTSSLDKRFLYYLFRTRPVRAQLNASATGTKVKHTSPERIHRVYVSVPADVRKQIRIAAVLSAYDDMIENNRRRIRLLERAARLIYGEWFLRLRFPGYQGTRVTDGLPDGWKKKILGDVIAKLESGGRPRGGSADAGIPSIGAENVIGIGSYDYSKDKYVPDGYFNAMRQGVVHSRDVVLYKDGANIGRSSYFGDGFPHDRCAVNEHVFIVRTRPEIGAEFLVFLDFGRRGASENCKP